VRLHHPIMGTLVEWVFRADSQGQRAASPDSQSCLGPEDCEAGTFA